MYIYASVDLTPLGTIGFVLASYSPQDEMGHSAYDESDLRVTIARGKAHSPLQLKLELKSSSICPAVSLFALQHGLC